MEACDRRPCNFLLLLSPTESSMWGVMTTTSTPLNAKTGAKVWSYATGGGVDSSPAITNGYPTIANGVVYVGSNDYNVYALNAATGRLVWSYMTGGIVSYSSPAVYYGVVYVGNWNHSIYALDKS